MTAKEYLQYLNLKIKFGTKAELKIWKDYEGKIQLMYKGIPFHQKNKKIVKTSEDINKVIELLDFYKKSNISCFRVINKKAIGRWQNCLIYKTEDVAIGWDENGAGCHSFSNKYILAEGNTVKGFFKSNNFYEAPTKLNIDIILPDEYNFKKQTKDDLDKKYPGLQEAFCKYKEKSLENHMTV